MVAAVQSFHYGRGTERHKSDVSVSAHRSRDYILSSVWLSTASSTIVRCLLRYWDYAGWGAALGMLAKQYPHLVCLEIDDFTHDVAPDEHGIFTPHVLALMQANLHRHSPTFNWAGSMYAINPQS